MTLNELIELAKEVESEDPIDWGMINIDEDEALRLIALSTFEQFADKLDTDEVKITMLVTIIKLVLENFALNLKLQQGK